MTTTFMLIQVHLDYHLKLGSNLKICSLLKLICKVMLTQDQPDWIFFFCFKTWKDPRLAWNTSHYGGVKSIRLKDSSIWRPDIEVTNQ